MCEAGPGVGARSVSGPAQAFSRGPLRRVRPAVFAGSARAWDTGPVPDYRILTICTGNVCRSPAAAVMLRHAVELAGLADRVLVESAGTSWESEGHPVDPRIVLSLHRAGYEQVPEHAARVVHQSEMPTWDLVLPMTLEHAESMRRKIDQIPEGEPHPEVIMWRQFDPTASSTATEAELGVKDPWYSGQKAFDRTVLEMERALPSLILFIRGRLREADESASR